MIVRCFLSDCNIKVTVYINFLDCLVFLIWQNVLRTDEQDSVKSYYLAHDRLITFNRHKSARVDSIQLIFQLVLIYHQYNNFPGVEFVFDESNPYLTPTTQWIGGLVVQIVSTILSAYSTLQFQLDVSSKICCR